MALNQTEVILSMFQIVLFGMVFSFAYNTARQTGVIDDSHRRKLFERGTSLIVLGLSLVALGVSDTLLCLVSGS